MSKRRGAQEHRSPSRSTIEQRPLDCDVMKALVAVALLASCRAEPKAKVADATYTARGQIVALPRSERSKEVEIHHESIPTFRNREGTVAGMMSMPMSFAPVPALSLAGISVGDKVTFTFDVRWNDRSPLVLTKLEKLPAVTELTLE